MSEQNKNNNTILIFINSTLYPFSAESEQRMQFQSLWRLWKNMLDDPQCHIHESIWFCINFGQRMIVSCVPQQPTNTGKLMNANNIALTIVQCFKGTTIQNNKTYEHHSSKT